MCRQYLLLFSFLDKIKSEIGSVNLDKLGRENKNETKAVYDILLDGDFSLAPKKRISIAHTRISFPI